MRYQYKIADTNIFLIDPIVALYGFGPKDQDTVNHLIIPSKVLNEMDKFKTEQYTERGYNSRVFSRELKKITREKGALSEPVKLRDNYFLQVSFESTPVPFTKDELINDDYIIGTAKYYAENHSNENVELITNDDLVYIKASSLGINVSDWIGARAVSSIEESYKGWRTVRAPKHIYNNLKDGALDITNTKIEGLEDIMPNEYILFVDENLPESYEVPIFNSKNENSTDFALARYVSNIKSFENGCIVHVNPRSANNSSVLSIKSRNYEQAFALDALLNPNIKLVNLIGMAGTGKTLLSLAAGINMLNMEDESKSKQYDRVIATRMMISSGGQELGALPGDIGDKMDPYMEPIYDNLKPEMFKKFIDKNGNAEPRKTKVLLEQKKEEINEIYKMNAFKTHLLNNDKLVIQPLQAMRGRSIDGAFFIVTEGQNLSPSEIKTIITRAGENTKIVVEGDPDQIDKKGLTDVINGLMHASEKFKEQEISATVKLFQGERSELATLGGKLL
ncbi:MAG: PhoH family protein [Candidatus Woesearchaeota archaeon]